MSSSRGEAWGFGRPPRRPTGLAMRVLVTTTVIAGLGVALPPLALATFRNHTSGSGRPQVEFVDESGNPATTPYFDGARTYPGMPPVEQVITIRNTGDLPGKYRLTAANPGSAGRHSLDEVLHVTVRDPVSGSVLYSGRLSDLTVPGVEPLDPGRSKSYVFEVTWPDGAADDNLYQGSSLSFDLRVDAQGSGG